MLKIYANFNSALFLRYVHCCKGRAGLEDRYGRIGIDPNHTNSMLVREMEIHSLKYFKANSGFLLLFIISNAS